MGEDEFESGPSLAECEHIPAVENGGLPTRNLTQIIDKRNLWQGGKNPDNFFQSTKTIDELRNAVCQDLITSNTTTTNTTTTQDPSKPDDLFNYSIFLSPFEIHNNNNNNNNKSVTSSSSSSLHVPLVYCDHTASNRSLLSLEGYLSKQCLPCYGNTHTNTSWTGSQTTAFVAEARQIVAEQVNAKITGKASLDVVLFTGSGATSAVQLLIDCLGLRHTPSDNRPVVFVGPYEHHSNLVPWRECGVEVVMVPECPIQRQVDLVALDRLLANYPSRRLKMGTFSAASNVTGKLSNVNAIAELLHKHGAWAFFDYATAAPYADSNLFNMNPPPSLEYPDPSAIAKDAIFFSPHKLLGGAAGTPGVLVVKKHLVSQVNAPNRSGGGTVFYVTHEHHRFLSNRVERYEGGTPHIMGILRIGLCFLWKRTIEQEYKALAALQQKQQQIKDKPNNALDHFTDTQKIPPTLLEYDLQTYRRVASYLKIHAPKLVLLGYDPDDTTQLQHLPIFSFLIRFDQHRFLHYNYVCAVLNDLFGIQSRGGCQCAGPYSQHLLGLTTPEQIPNDRNQKIERALVKHKERAELLRPGYTRVSLPFKGLSSMEVDYVLEALVWVSKHAWALMCQYRCNHRTGEWRHAARHGKPLGTERRWLSHYQPFAQDSIGINPLSNPNNRLSVKDMLARTLQQADQVLAAAMQDQRSIAQALKMADADSVLGGSVGDDDADNLEFLRWYAYPKECALRLSRNKGGDDDLEEDVAPDRVLGAINPFFNPSSCAATIKEGTEQCCGEAVWEKKRKVDTGSENQNNGVFLEGVDQASFALVDGARQRKADVQEGSTTDEVVGKAARHDSLSDDFVNLSSCKKPKTSDQAADRIEPQTIKTSRLTQDCQTKKAARDHSSWGQGEIANIPRMSFVDPNQRENHDANLNDASDLAKTEVSEKKKRAKHVKPPPKLMKLVTQAVFQWDMIQEGDRLLLGLSGGKDSLSLLHCLLELQRKLPTKFELQVCTIDPMTPSFDPSPLIPYVETLGLKYHYIRDDIVARAVSSGKDGKMVSSLCAFCARMKRGNLYNVARKNQCNKLVLAQHLDDCAESFMMSVMHNGFLRTMKANYEINAGDLSVIRPMVYCRESLMTEFSKSAMLPVINENCPACFEEPKERARIKKLLSREELNYPNFYDNIRRSLMPLMHPHSEAVMHSFTEDAVSKSRKKWTRPKVVEESGTHNGTVRGKGDWNVVETLENNNINDNNNETSGQKVLADLSDEDLMAELARRRSARFRLAGAMKSIHHSESDPSNISSSCEIGGGGGACSLFD